MVLFRVIIERITAGIRIACKMLVMFYFLTWLKSYMDV